MIELLDSDSGRRVAIACNACSMKITGAATAVLVPPGLEKQAADEGDDD